MFFSFEYHVYRRLESYCFEFFDDENMVFLSQKVDEI